MTREFKSSAGALCRHFIVVLIFIVMGMFFLVGGGGMLLDLDKDDISQPTVLISCGVFAVALAAYLAFIRHRFTVLVTLDGVTLSRGKRVYLVLPAQDFVFGTYTHKSYNSAGIYTSRYLRTFNKQTGKRTDYRLYFSKKRMEELLETVVAWLNYKTVSD